MNWTKPTLSKFHIMVNGGGSVMVKEDEFFLSQGGELEAWGRRWVEIEAESIEKAREIGCSIFKFAARPYEKQAKEGDRPEFISWEDSHCGVPGCHLKQWRCPGGITCDNGHGGAPSI